MTALQFYTSNQQEGRALLYGDPVRFFDQNAEAGRGKRLEEAQWLIRLRGQLVLCQDRVEYPMLRLVDDNEQFPLDLREDSNEG